MGTGGDPERGRAIAEEQFATLKTACEGADVILIVAGLGGGAGSGISPVLARAAKETGALVLAFVTLPFLCEGNRRQQQAQQSLEQLKSVADGVICLPSQKTFKLIDENTSVLDTFRITGGLLVEGVRGVWQLLTRPGLIQIHFDDLCALVRDRHSESVFAFVEASGAGRSREVVEKLLAHPLLDEGRALAESDAVLVSLMGGKDLTMAEVNRVMEQISRQCERAQIIMGAAVDAEMKNKLSVTVIAAKKSVRKKSIASFNRRFAGADNFAERVRLARESGIFPSGGRVVRAPIASARADDCAPWPRAQVWFQNAAGTVAAGDCFQGPLRQKRADDPQGRGFGHSDLPPSRRAVELKAGQWSCL